MATQLKLRQGNEKENGLYIGALGELTYDTEQQELHVHDGTNPGGNVCLKKSSTDLDAKQDLNSSININNITNCITEIPQNVKVEVNSENQVVLKAGSKLYRPNGVGVFDEYVTNSDKTTSSTGTFVAMLFVRKDGTIWASGIDAVSSGTTAPTGTGTFYNTDTNTIDYYSGGTYNERTYTLPFAVVQFTDGVPTIKQIFNGYGFIGSELFALPGLTCALPNGLQNNGKIKNIYRTVANVDMWHENGNTYTSLGIRNINDNPQISRCGNGFASVQQLPELEDAPIYCAFYLSPENAFYRKENSTAYSKQDWCQIGDYITDSANNYRITSLMGKHVFQALDYNDTSLMSQAHMPSDKYVDVSLGSSGTTYTVKNNGYFFIRTVANQGDGWITMCTDNDSAFGQTTRFVSGNDVRMLIPVQSGTFIQLYYSNLGNGTGGQANIFRFIYTQGVE